MSILSCGEKEEKKRDHSNDRILCPQPNAALCESNISCAERKFRTVALRTLQEHLAHKKQPSPLRTPYDPRYRPTAGFWGGCVFL